MARTRLIALSIAVLLAATACGNGTSSTAAVDDEFGGRSGTAHDTALVLPTADGGQLAINELQGRPAMLWFWAPW